MSHRGGATCHLAGLNYHSRGTACLWIFFFASSYCSFIAALCRPYVSRAWLFVYGVCVCECVCVSVPRKGRRPLHSVSRSRFSETGVAVCVCVCVSVFVPSRMCYQLHATRAHFWYQHCRISSFLLQPTWGPCSPATPRKSQADGFCALPQLKAHSCCVHDVASEAAPLTTD